MTDASASEQWLECRAVIIIPAWKATATIGRAIASALSQTEPCHVVVVDDASPDDTVAAAKAADDGSGRLTILSQSRNTGPAAARNRAIDASRAPWVALLDSDDFMQSDRIANLLAIAEQDETPAWDMVADDLYRMRDDQLDGPSQRLISHTDFPPYTLDFEAFVLGNVHGSRGSRGELGFLKPLMRRDFLQQAELRYDETMRLGEDYDLYARALARGARFRIINPLGYMAVERAASLSGSHRSADLAQILAADRRILAQETLNAQQRAAVRKHLAPIRREKAWMQLVEAVQGRSIKTGLSVFIAPPDVFLSLLWRLLKWGWHRTTRHGS